MAIDYKKYNHCITCKITYPKNKRYCDDCGFRLRTVSHTSKAATKQRVRDLDKKRY